MHLGCQHPSLDIDDHYDKEYDFHHIDIRIIMKWATMMLVVN